VRVVLLPDDESFEDLLGMLQSIDDVLTQAGFEVSTVEVYEDDFDDVYEYEPRRPMRTVYLPGDAP
jgi:predicted metal-dependent TIM-barrel fold hydrolase